MEDFQAYGEFARVYDMFQDNVDYQLWASWLKGQLKKFGFMWFGVGSWLWYRNYDRASC